MKATKTQQADFNKSLAEIIVNMKKEKPMKQGSILIKVEGVIEAIQLYGVRRNIGAMYDEAIITCIKKDLFKAKQVEDSIFIDTKTKKYSLKEPNYENRKDVIRRTDKILKRLQYVISEFLPNKEILTAMGETEARAQSIIRDITNSAI